MMIIRNNFVRAEDGTWVNLDFILDFSVEIVQKKWAVIFLFNDGGEKVVETFGESEEEKQKAQKYLDKGFHLYSDHDREIWEVCHEHEIEMTVRTGNLLARNGVKSVKALYELMEKGVLLPSMGKKSWLECWNLVHKLKHIVP